MNTDSYNKIYAELVDEFKVEKELPEGAKTAAMIAEDTGLTAQHVRDSLIPKLLKAGRIREGGTYIKPTGSPTKYYFMNDVNERS